MNDQDKEKAYFALHIRSKSRAPLTSWPVCPSSTSHGSSQEPSSSCRS